MASATWNQGDKALQQMCCSGVGIFYKTTSVWTILFFNLTINPNVFHKEKGLLLWPGKVGVGGRGGGGEEGTCSALFRNLTKLLILPLTFSWWDPFLCLMEFKLVLVTNNVYGHENESKRSQIWKVQIMTHPTILLHFVNQLQQHTASTPWVLQLNQRPLHILRSVNQSTPYQWSGLLTFLSTWEEISLILFLQSCLKESSWSLTRSKLFSCSFFCFSSFILHIKDKLYHVFYTSDTAIT